MRCSWQLADEQPLASSDQSVDRSVTVIDVDDGLGDGFDDSGFDDTEFDEDIDEGFSDALKESLLIKSVKPLEIYQQGGDTLTIKGQGFIKEGIKVLVEGVKCLNVVVKTPELLVCKTPNNMSVVGKATLTLERASDETLDREINILTVIGPPVIDEVIPAEAESTGGEIINIKGRSFNANVKITFDGAPCEIVEFFDSQSIACRAPAGIVDAVPEIKITDRKGQFSVYDGVFRYLEPAYVSSIDPQVIPIVGGNRVTMIGAGFKAGASAYLGGGQCRDVEVISRTELTCKAPTASAAGLPSGGPFEAKVILSSGRVVESEQAISGEYLRLPRIDGVEPNEGILAGGQTVFIIGSNFSEGMTIEFVDDANNPNLRAACSSLTFISGARPRLCHPRRTRWHRWPSTACSEPIALVNHQVLIIVTSTKARPNIAYVVHDVTGDARGPMAGGGLLRITGSGFIEDPRNPLKLTVSIGAIDCPIVSIGPAEVSCNLPASEEAETYTITLTNSDTQAAQLVDGFSYTAPAVVTSVINQANNSNFRTEIDNDYTLTITGSGFYGDPLIEVDTQICSINSVSATELVCSLPSLRSHSDPVVGDVAVTVTNGDGQQTILENGFQNLVLLNAADLSFVCEEAGLENPLYCGSTEHHRRIRISDAEARLIRPVQVTVGGSSCNNVSYSPANDYVLCNAPRFSSDQTISIQVASSASEDLVDQLHYYPRATITGITPRLADSCPSQRRVDHDNRQ